MTTGLETTAIAGDVVQEVLRTAGDLCARHGISALEDFVETARAFAQEKLLNIAVLGRFKAGKSSFLNHLIGRRLLPVGVIPVTSVVTEIQWGSVEQAEIMFTDGRRERVSTRRIGEFISESQNPENRKGVARVRVELPSMDHYRGITFVDTPGLDSVFEHNSDTSLEWLPNVGLALVAVGVDTPLSQHDIELIRNLRRYTPNISLLLTKVDVLDEAERIQVREFVQSQLARHGNDAVAVFPYSIRPGFDGLRDTLDATLLSRARAEAGEQRSAILVHKLDTLLRECGDYLNVALKAAEVTDAEREDLRRKILGQQQALDDTRLASRLIVRHAAATTRATFEDVLRADESPIRKRFHQELDREFPRWTASLLIAMNRFDDWLRARLSLEMMELSRKHRDEFLAPARRVSRQLSQSLQDFRNRLSDRMLESLGVPLRTTQIELRTDDPKSPDVRVGKIFDHNWELLSWMIPMALVKGAVLQHYHRKVDDLVFTSLSRLTSQWEAAVNDSLRALEKECLRRLDSLMATIDKLIASAGQEAPQIRADLQVVQELRQRLNGG